MRYGLHGNPCVSVKYSALVWHAKLKIPQHIPPHHIKLLNQLYIEVQKKKQTVTYPYAESIQLCKRLYQDETMRDETNLSKREKSMLTKAGKWQNPSKAPAGSLASSGNTLCSSPDITRSMFQETERAVSCYRSRHLASM